MDNIKLSDLIECKECACLNLRKAARTTTQLYDQAMLPIGLRSTQFALLAITRGQPNLSVSELAEMMAMDRTTLTRNLKPLEKRGLINITPGADRRIKLISITRDGQRMLARAIPIWQQTQRKVVDNFGDVRFKSLLKDLADISIGSGI